MKKIISIKKGWGEGIEYFRVGFNGVDKIVKKMKVIEYVEDQPFKDIVVYTVLSEEGEVLCEIESNSGLTVYYDLNNGYNRAYYGF